MQRPRGTRGYVTSCAARRAPWRARARRHRRRVVDGERSPPDSRRSVRRRRRPAESTCSDRPLRARSTSSCAHPRSVSPVVIESHPRRWPRALATLVPVPPSARSSSPSMTSKRTRSPACSWPTEALGRIQRPDRGVLVRGRAGGRHAVPTLSHGSAPPVSDQRSKLDERPQLGLGH